MKVTRKLTLPGRRESEYSSWEIELSSEEIKQLSPVASVQDMLQVLCLEAQARVLSCAVADGLMTNDEMSARLIGFIGATPEWLNKLQETKSQP